MKHTNLGTRSRIKSWMTIETGLIAFLLITLFSLPESNATPTNANYAEIAVALSTIPVDMAAQHYELKNETKKAAALHLTVDALSIINKVLFFYNNINGQKQKGLGTWDYEHKSFLVQSTFLMRDFTKIYQHLKELRYGKIVEQDDFNDLTNNDLTNIEFTDTEAKEENVSQENTVPEISKIEYAWKVFGLSSLKGLTAFALACAQEDVTEDYSWEQARSVASAAYSLVRLSEEYTALKRRSAMREILTTALVANALWLAYELVQYKQNPKPMSLAKARRVLPQEEQRAREQAARGQAGQRQGALPIRRQQMCPSCHADDRLSQLNCGHGNCMDCLQTNVRDRYLTRNDQDGLRFNNLRCPAGCGQHLTRNDLQQISNGIERLPLAPRQRHPVQPAEILAAFDEAEIERLLLQSPVAMEARRVIALADPDNQAAINNAQQQAQRGFQVCPHCTQGVERRLACQHMTCSNCTHQFCILCAGNWHGHDYAACQAAHPNAR